MLLGLTEVSQPHTARTPHLTHKQDDASYSILFSLFCHLCEMKGNIKDWGPRCGNEIHCLRSAGNEGKNTFGLTRSQLTKISQNFHWVHLFIMIWSDLYSLWISVFIFDRVSHDNSVFKGMFASNLRKKTLMFWCWCCFSVWGQLKWKPFSIWRPVIALASLFIVDVTEVVYRID